MLELRVKIMEQKHPVAVLYSQMSVRNKFIRWTDYEFPFNVVDRQPRSILHHLIVKDWSLNNWVCNKLKHIFFNKPQLEFNLIAAPL